MHDYPEGHNLSSSLMNTTWKGLLISSEI